MKDEYMVKLTKKQVEELVELLDDYLTFKWDGYDTMRSTWNAIFHRMKVDDDSLPLYAIRYDEQRKKHIVVDVEKFLKRDKKFWEDAIFATPDTANDVQYDWSVYVDGRGDSHVTPYANFYLPSTNNLVELANDYCIENGIKPILADNYEDDGRWFNFYVDIAEINGRMIVMSNRIHVYLDAEDKTDAFDIEIADKESKFICEFLDLLLNRYFHSSLEFHIEEAKKNAEDNSGYISGED